MQRVRAHPDPRAPTDSRTVLVQLIDVHPRLQVAALFRTVTERPWNRTLRRKRTTTVYAPSGEARELNKNEPEDVLEATGTAIADAVGFVVDKTVEGAKTVGEKTVEGTRTVGEKTAAGAKTVGEKTVQGAKKTGTAIKKAVTP